MTNMYKTCGEIPIWNLHEVFKTKDLKYMFSNYSDIESLEVTEDIVSNWDALYYEYLELLDDPGMTLYYELSKDLQYLQTRFTVAHQLLEIVFHRCAKEQNVEKYVAELREWGFKINLKNDLLEEIAKKVRQLKGSEVRIRIVEKELEDLKESQGDPMSLIDQSVELELALGKADINPKTTVAEKWISYYKKLERINARKRFRNGKL